MNTQAAWNEKAEWIETADLAKLIRRAVKLAFPGVKFAVRSNKYSGGSSVVVEWTGGPLRHDVEAVACLFQGVTFDGMDDSTHFVPLFILPDGSAWNGEGEAPAAARRFSSGAYVRCSRQ